MRTERKVITALYADLANSTPLGERLDPEDVRLVVCEAVSRMVRAVERYGGTVKDLAGDAVVAFFGAPRSHEDDPERAIRAGLQIVADLRPYAREVEDSWGIEGFGVRVGVCTGEAVLGAIGTGDRVEYAAFGDTVNTAARVQARARTGRVLVAETTRRHVVQAFKWGEPIELDLKGKSVPVIAYEVLGEAESRHPKARSGLVGREQELERALDAGLGVLAGSGHALFVTGDAGIGKTRFVAEVRDRIRAAESPAGEPICLEGHCVSYGESMPYWPFRGLLMDWLGMTAQDPDLKLRIGLRRQVEAECGGEVMEIYPYLATVLGTALEQDAAASLHALGAEELRHRIFEALGRLFRRLTENRPLILVLEDLQWADATSVELLRELVPLTEDAAVLLLVTSRPERDHASWEVREEALRKWPHRATELALPALPAASSAELLRTLKGEIDFFARLERRVLELAEGNPFYLEEIVRELAESGSLSSQDPGAGAPAARLPIPVTIEKVILGRIDRLSPACRDVLTAAAVLGLEFGLRPLEGIVENGAGVPAALRELQRLDLVRESRRWPHPEYRFKHALIQEATYRTLLASSRQELHRRAAIWFEETYAGDRDEVLGLLAHHWRAADDRERAIDCLAAAAEQAGRGWAKQEALNLWDQALQLVPKEDEAARRRIAMKRGIALMLFLHGVEDVREAPPKQDSKQAKI